MSKKDQRALAAKINKDLEEKRAAALAKKNANTRLSNTLNRRVGSGVSIASTIEPSNFFAYNPRALKRAQRDFRKKWNDRPLEDDWRRSNKQSLNDLDVNEGDVAETGSELSDDEVQKILKDVPRTQAQKDAALRKIEESTFHLGRLYHEKLQYNEKAIATLEQLLERFPNTEFELEAYYYMYLAHLDLRNNNEAEKNRLLIIEKYPESTYARVLIDPDYLNKSRMEEKRLVQYYDATYAAFTSGNVDDAMARINQVDEKFGSKNKLDAKFALLAAHCDGQLTEKMSLLPL